MIVKQAEGDEVGKLALFLKIAKLIQKEVGSKLIGH